MWCVVRVITVYVILFHGKPGLLNKLTSDGVDERELLALIRYAPCSDIDKLYSYAALYIWKNFGEIQMCSAFSGNL